MAQFQWRFDAPAGVYKSHALSRKLFEAATEKSVMMDFVQPVDGFGKGMGEDVTLTRIANITEPTSAVLTEGERIPEDEFSFTTTNIVIQELGRSVPFTSFSNDLSFFDLQNPVQRKLVSQWRLVLDTKIAGVYKGASVKYAITGLATNNITTNGTFGATSTANMNVYHVEEIRDYMFDTLHAPPVDGDNYVGVFRTLGLRGIKRDPAWEEWHKYTDPQAKFNNEIGRIENIRFVESNHANAFGKVGTGSALGEGVVFGEDSVAMAEALTPELRAQVNVGDDFGRNHAVAWYALLNFGLIWTTGNAGEAKVLHVGSL
jgi:N4-gp56 family major capsid protein